MNRALVDPIANAVLYEGYILYPYRPAVKNCQRWTFGGLYPEGFPGEAASSQTECIVRGDAATRCEVVVRCLHLTARTARELLAPVEGWPDGDEPPSRPVAALRVGNKVFPSWQEAQECEVLVGPWTFGELRAQTATFHFTFPGGRAVEPVPYADGKIVGLLERRQQALAGAVELAAVDAGPGLLRLTVQVRNRTPCAASGADRDAALLRTLISTHIVLGVNGGTFVSAIDPDADAHAAAAACRNVGLWPVLLGLPGQADTMLAAPIILYDYPRIAPESPGDFFDGTEIDEMLSLRIATLTDDEKAAMAAVDRRTRALLARTESATPERMRGLHGTLRPVS